MVAVEYDGYTFLHCSLGRSDCEVWSTKHFQCEQGSQFTSETFLCVLQDYGIQISMDGKDRALDNIYKTINKWS